jgi:AAA domain
VAANRFAKLSDPGKEAAIAGSIAAGTFEAIPERDLIPADAFTDPRWRIVYSVAVELRKENSDQIVCAEAVTDAIAFRLLDAEFQRAFDSTQTLDWHTWPGHADPSCAHSPAILRYLLSELGRLYRHRQFVALGQSIVDFTVEPADAFSNLENILHQANGHSLEPLVKRKFEFENVPEKPSSVFTLCGQQIATAGNIISVYSQAKAGKSAVLSAMMAAAFSDDALCDFLGFAAAPNTPGRALVHFDTEQSRYDADQLIRRALRRADIAGPPPPWLRSYWLTDIELAQRRQLLRDELEAASKACGGIYCVLIDGVGDLVVDVNDITETQNFVIELHALAIRYDCPIVGVLHENPGGQTEKQRGHLGSQLERKAESNIRLVKDSDGITVIYTEKSRHANIPRSAGHRFKWSDEDAMHTTFEAEQNSRPDAHMAEKHFAQELFNCPQATGGLSWAQIHARISELADLKQPGARRRFQKLLGLGFIEKNSAGFYLLAHVANA